MEIISALLITVILALAVFNGYLAWNSYHTNKRINTLLENGKIKEFKDIFLRQKEKNDGLEQKIKEAFVSIKNLELISKKTVQKTAVVRFNPFNEVGGNQSFVIALLDAENNGFVISSLFLREGNRVYTKSVKVGKSDFALSKEEKEAVNKAISSC